MSVLVPAPTAKAAPAATPTTSVNESLARGLRARTIAHYTAMAERYEAFLRQTFQATVARQWTAKRSGALERLLQERAPKRALATFQFTDSRASYFAQYAPRVEGDRLLIDIVETRLHGRQRPLPQATVLLEITPHAVERLFLRLRTTELAPLQQELLAGLMLTMSLRTAAAQLELQQLVIPTHGGAFLCRHTAAPGNWVAATWVATGDPEHGVGMNRRQASVVEAIRAAAAPFREAAKKGDMSLAMAALGGDMGPAGVTAVGAAMEAALRPFAWLREPYTPRPDRLSERWNAAQAQQAAEARLPAPGEPLSVVARTLRP